MICTTESYGVTDTGRRRQVNQDYVLFDDELRLYIVADGMGGHSAGEVASKLAAESVREFVVRSRCSADISWPFGLDPRLSLNGNCLRSAVMLANARVCDEAAQHEELYGMGTTIVAAVAEKGVLTICSAGDSRAYRIRSGSIRQLTKDDSWVQAALDRGVLEEGQARNHIMRNIITKAVGADDELEPCVVEEETEPGDLYLMCTDGLHGMLGDAEILGIIRASAPDLRKAVDSLIAAANANGGNDNVTALLLRCLSAND